ncbi:VOC family protein [Roseobacter litoralis]|uniref:VOC family protein n=1 Tax=Roseobacter litoralis TaxID=42443 RepID=UPI002494DB3F|nr:VOC family protein [Roseobacter litoralis]
MITFDHIAIAGETLEAARAYVEDALGVTLQDGGAHDVFFTHNALLGLEDGLYLEAIAINPHAPQPDRSRWFDLDRFKGAPRLTNWICRTDDLRNTLEKLPAGFGTPVALKRGDLRWQMAVPQDGILPFDNCGPALIEWQSAPHPAERLRPSDITLRRLTITHPQADGLNAALRGQMQDDRIVIETGPVGMHAEFDTPHGLRTLGS